MQLNPARGRKHDNNCQTSPQHDAPGLCSSTPRGDGNTGSSDTTQRILVSGLCSSTPRGDGNCNMSSYIVLDTDTRFMQLNPAWGRKRLSYLANTTAQNPRFMQLNPARGRKPSVSAARMTSMHSRFMQLNPARGRKPDDLATGKGHILAVYAAQPREGTETISHHHSPQGYLRFMQLNPARGRKPDVTLVPLGDFSCRVYAAQPREGTETTHHQLRAGSQQSRGLCSSTPRGDGNTRKFFCRYSWLYMVYAAQPREGTETYKVLDETQDGMSLRFMQLNPARGRKLACVF